MFISLRMMESAATSGPPATVGRMRIAAKPRTSTVNPRVGEGGPGGAEAVYLVVATVSVEAVAFLAAAETDSAAETVGVVVEVETVGVVGGGWGGGGGRGGGGRSWR